MLRNISLGTYTAGESILHRLQARTKLLIMLLFVVTLFIAARRVWHFAPFISLIGLLCLTIVVARISWSVLWRRSWLLFLLVVVGSIPVVFSTSSGDKSVLVTIGPLFIAYGVLRIMLLIISAALVILLGSSRLPFSMIRRIWRSRWLRAIRIVLILVLCIALIFLWVIHTENATQLLPIGPLPITQTGIWTFVTVSVILMTLYILSLLLTMSTSPIALVEGLTMLLAPLRVLHLPIDDFALMTLISLRFIPTLLEEVEQLSRAQAARGADMTQGTFRERAQSLTMLFVPLMQGIFRRAEELATALEARGYRSDGKQTRLYERSLRARDYLAMGSIALIMIGSLFL